MQKLINWVGTQGAWNASELGLPTLDGAADAAVQRWCAVAGGLALILSRLAPSERTARFSATHTLYLLVRNRLRQSRPVLASPELVGEVMHEIAEVADPLTRSCLKTCFHASLLGGGAGADAGLPAGDSGYSAPAASSLPPRVRPSGAPSTSPENQPAATSQMPQELQERSAELRRKLAAARSTGFAELG